METIDHVTDVPKPVDQVEIVDTTQDKSSHIIKHLVIAGGGTYGLIAYGALREAHASGIWNIENIESIYGTSIGALIAVVLSLKYDWTVTDDYFIKRPWHNIFKWDIQTLFAAFTKRGMFDKKMVEEVLDPLFRGLDISLDITLREFFELTHIDIHLYATNVNKFCLVDISQATHPEWKVVEAVYASACLPLFFAPFSKDGEYYLDGGVFLNYPLEPCIRRSSHIDEILGIRKEYVQSSSDSIHEESSLIDYVLVLLNHALKRITMDTTVAPFKHEFKVKAALVSMNDLFTMASSEERRRQWIMEGVDAVKEWMIIQGSS